jgi:hypothetical protein
MITDQQARRLRRLDVQGVPRERAAAQAGVDPKAARKYRRLGRLPSEVRRRGRDGLTRPDAFADIWPQLVSLGGRLDLALDRLADALDPTGWVW